MLKEILTSTAFALAGGLGASGGAMWVLGRLKRSQRPMAATLLSVLTSVPGLVGTLILSLAVLAAVQIPILSFFYRNSLPVPLERMVTSLPLALTLVVWLLPRAMLLRLMLHARSPREPLHAARLLADSPLPSKRRASRDLVWHMQARGAFWTMALLCYWAYWDLTAPSILMPIGMVAAPVRLYNFMHYSQTALLSAMLCATMAFPLVLLAAFAWLQRFALRRLIG